MLAFLYMSYEYTNKKRTCMMTDKNKKNGNKKGFASVPIREKKKSDKKNAVENITTEQAADKLFANCGETANFIGRLMYDEKFPLETIVICTIDCAYAVEISPAEFIAFLKTKTNMLIETYPDKLKKKWNRDGVSFRADGVEIGEPVV